MPLNGSLPLLDQINNIANFPKALFEAASHGRGHTNGAVDPGEVANGSTGTI